MTTSNWEFMVRRRKWSVSKIAVQNSIKTINQFCEWCDKQKISHPPQEELNEYFKPKQKKDVVSAKDVKPEPVKDIESPSAEKSRPIEAPTPDPVFRSKKTAVRSNKKKMSEKD